MRNNKGTTLVEIIVSVALISIVMVFLVGLLIDLRDIDDKSLKRLEYEEKIALITKQFQDTIQKYDACSFKVSNDNTLKAECESYKVNLSCNDNDNDINKNTCVYTDDDNNEKSWTFPDEATISKIQVKNDSDNKYMYQYEILDNKGNVYILEISYINT